MPIRHIHQTWKDSTPPREIFSPRWIASWKELNPGWEYTLWTDDDLDRFVAAGYPEFYPTWKAYPSAIMRVDAWRYLLLKERGGLYVDLDFACLEPLDRWLPMEPVFHAGDQGDSTCNALMWAPEAGLPFFDDLEKELTRCAEHPNVIFATGPRFLTSYAAARPELCRVMPREWLYPLAWNSYAACAAAARLPHEALARQFPESRAITFWTSTWVKKRGEAMPEEASPARILVAICSCEAHAERRQACRDTWLRNLPPGMEAVFFLGGGEAAHQREDVVQVEAPDDYHNLALKVRRFFQYALEQFEFDWLFKCDDDTYLVPERLPELLSGRCDLVGNEFLLARRAPSGGAGYGLARWLVKRLAGDDSLANGYAEDLILGRAAVEMGAQPKTSKRLRYDHALFPAWDNDLVSAHWCRPVLMRSIHQLFDSKAKEEVTAEHSLWSDTLTLYRDGHFRRSSTPCCGTWREESSGELTLEWFEWGTERFRNVLKPAGIKAASGEEGQRRFRLIPRIEKTLYVHLAGGLGNQLFQYAYGLALSEKLDMGLKLIHSGGGRPFALGGFGLSISRQPEMHTMQHLRYGRGYSADDPWPLLADIHLSEAPNPVIYGYFQNERYFHGHAPALRERFQQRHPMHRDRSGTLVGVHVRRGDFAGNPLHDLCTESYYRSAITQMRNLLPGADFLVFTDDAATCRKQFPELAEFEFFKGASDIEAFAALQGCDAFVLSNSTFGWWAAWLSGSLQVIAPSRFLSDREWPICPPKWTRLEV